MSAAAHHPDAVSRRRRRLSRTWAVMVISWSLIRTTVVWATLGDYGLDPWAYLAVDLGSASIDAFSTPRMVTQFIDHGWRRALRWALLSLTVFVLPDLYIFLGTRSLPTRIVVAICVIVCVMASVGVYGVVRKVKAGRLLRTAAVPAPVRV